MTPPCWRHCRIRIWDRRQRPYLDMMVRSSRCYRIVMWVECLWFSSRLTSTRRNVPKPQLQLYVPTCPQLISQAHNSLHPHPPEDNSHLVDHYPLPPVLRPSHRYSISGSSCHSMPRLVYEDEADEKRVQRFPELQLDPCRGLTSPCPRNILYGAFCQWSNNQTIRALPPDARIGRRVMGS